MTKGIKTNLVFFRLFCLWQKSLISNHNLNWDTFKCLSNLRQMNQNVRKNVVIFMIYILLVDFQSLLISLNDHIICICNDACIYNVFIHESLICIDARAECHSIFHECHNGVNQSCEMLKVDEPGKRIIYNCWEKLIYRPKNDFSFIVDNGYTLSNM